MAKEKKIKPQYAQEKKNANKTAAKKEKTAGEKKAENKKSATNTPIRKTKPTNKNKKGVVAKSGAAKKEEKISVGAKSARRSTKPQKHELTEEAELFLSEYREEKKTKKLREKVTKKDASSTPKTERGKLRVMSLGGLEK